jgi:hypothetical protein
MCAPCPEEQRLSVSQQSDPAEREAERVADRVGASAPVRRSPEAGGCSCAAEAAPASPAAGLVRRATEQAGQPLGEGVRTEMESAFGRRFEDVRLHEGTEASRAASSVSARAFTVGSDIVLGRGAPSPESGAGRRLLAHELTHVLQQREAGGLGGGAASVQRQTTPVVPGDEAVPQEPEISGVGEEAQAVAYANIRLQGVTNASFSSSFRTSGVSTRAGEGGCRTVSGTLVNTFRVSTTVTLPPVPTGLTACQQGNVSRFISTILAPHEQDHVTRFNTFNGTTSRPFSFTVCPGDNLPTLVQAEHDSERQARQAAAQALSDEIDPFDVDVDIDAGCSPP